MPEDQSEKPEKVDEAGGGESQLPKLTEVNRSDAREESLERAKESTDDRIVEAAAEEGGLRGALRERLNQWHTTSMRRWEAEKSYFLGRSGQNRFEVRFPAKLGLTLSRAGLTNWALKTRITSFLRSRLEPKPQAPSVAK